MARSKALVITLPVLALAALFAPLLVPKNGGLQPIRHRYDTYRACNELMPLGRGIKADIDLPLRWWHLFGWRSELREVGAYMWTWRTDLSTPGGTVRALGMCMVEQDRNGRWSLLQGLQVPVDEAGHPIGSFTQLCAEHPERCR